MIKIEEIKKQVENKKSYDKFIEKELKNGLKFIRNNGNFIKQSKSDIWGKEIILHDKKCENEYKYKLENWYMTLSIDKTTNINELINNFKKFAQSKDNGGNKFNYKDYTCYQLCDWTWLKDNENHIITNGKATLVKYAKILKDID